jgi:hypothetical protein
MFQGNGVVLESGGHIGHGRISGIACVGKETKVGETIFPHNLRTLFKKADTLPIHIGGVAEKKAKENNSDAKTSEKKIGFSDSHQSRPFTMA